jgi:hypothetical protein
MLQYGRGAWNIFGGMTQIGWSGMLQYGIRDLVFNIEPRWAEKVELN